VRLSFCFDKGLTQIESYEEIKKDYEVTYVAGGASQNAARGAAVRLSIHNDKPMTNLAYHTFV